MEGSTIAAMYMEALAKHYGFSLDTPVASCPTKSSISFSMGPKGKKFE